METVETVENGANDVLEAVGLAGEETKDDEEKETNKIRTSEDK